MVWLEELGGIFAVIHFVGYLERTSSMESNNLPGLWPVALGVRLSRWLWRCWTQRIEHTHLFQMCKPVSVTGKLLKEEHRQLHSPQYPLWLVLLGLHALGLPCQLLDTSWISIFPLFHFLPLQSLSLWESCSPTFSAQCKFLIDSNIIYLYLPAGWTGTLCSHKYNAFCLIECSRTCLVFASCLLSVLLNVYFFSASFFFRYGDMHQAAAVVASVGALYKLPLIWNGYHCDACMCASFFNLQLFISQCWNLNEQFILASIVFVHFQSGIQGKSSLNVQMAKLQMRKVTMVLTQSYYSWNFGQNVNMVCSFHLKLLAIDASWITNDVVISLYLLLFLHLSLFLVASILICHM